MKRNFKRSQTELKSLLTHLAYFVHYMNNEDYSLFVKLCSFYFCFIPPIIQSDLDNLRVARELLYKYIK